jgi:LacI family transcriptional regulator
MVNQTTIARRLNLSQRTVSACLSGSGKISKQTRQRVLETANEMGYRPNRSALSMRTGRFNTVAMLQSTQPGFSDLPEFLLSGLQDGLIRLGVHLMIASVPDEQLCDEGFLPSVLREWAVDGFLVNYNYGFSLKMVDVIERNHLPSVWLNCKRTHDCSYPDDVGAGRRLTEHLLGLGHRRIAFFSHRLFEGHFSVGDRYFGYSEAMAEAGLPARKLFYADGEGNSSEDALRFVRSVLESPDRPTAIVAYEIREATRILYMSLRLGLSIPEDLSLVTVCERPAEDLGLPITVLRIPHAAEAEAALDVLMRRINGEEHIAPRVVPYREMTGASTAPPRNV